MSGPRERRVVPILTPAQTRALAGMADGHSVKGYAAVAHIAEQTAKFHLADARRRLGARSTLHAVVLAIEAGLIEVPRPRPETRCPRCGGSGKVSG